MQETYFWQVEVYGFILDTQMTYYIGGESGWDRESHIKFLEQVRTRSVYWLVDHKGPIKVTNSKKVETVEVVEL